MGLFRLEGGSIAGFWPEGGGGSIAGFPVDVRLVHPCLKVYEVCKKVKTVPLPLLSSFSSFYWWH